MAAMSPSVKFFSSTMTGAPVLSGTKGSLISVLDACLVNGWGLVTVNSLTVSNGVATATVAAGHSFVQYQVLLIAGAAPAGLNGEKRVIAITGTTFSFDATGISDQTATGTITAKVATLGWIKAFSGTNKAAYKIDTSLYIDSPTCLMRIDDSGNYGAQMTGYESMSTVDAGTAPFPTATQQSTGLWIYRSNATDSTARAWSLIGDGRTIYLGACYSSSTAYAAPWVGWGEFKTKKSPDPYRFFLSANSTADNINTPDASQSLMNSYRTGSQYLSRNYIGLGGGVLFQQRTWPGNYGASGGGGAPIAYPNGADYGLYLCPVQVQGAQSLNELFIAKASGPSLEDALGGKEEFRRHDRLKGALLLDPHVGGILHPALLELEGDAVVDVITDVFFVGENLVHRAPGPGPTEVGGEPLLIEALGDDSLGQTPLDEVLVNIIDHADFIVGTRHEDDPVGLQALVLTPSQFALAGA